MGFFLHSRFELLTHKLCFPYIYTLPSIFHWVFHLGLIYIPLYLCVFIYTYFPILVYIFPNSQNQEHTHIFIYPYVYLCIFIYIYFSLYIFSRIPETRCSLPISWEHTTVTIFRLRFTPVTSYLVSYRQLSQSGGGFLDFTVVSVITWHQLCVHSLCTVPHRRKLKCTGNTVVQ
jgi:hypothetical protein